MGACCSSSAGAAYRRPQAESTQKPPNDAASQPSLDAHGSPASLGVTPPTRTSYMRSTDALRCFLEEHGVCTKEFGKGTSKSISALLSEVQSASSYLELEQYSGQEAQLVRIVEPVFLRLCWRTRVLVQEAQEFADGRRRTRRMFLAEKKEPRDGGGLSATMTRAIHEELSIPLQAVQAAITTGALVFRHDTYHFEIERINSASYPGLTSVYRTHYVQVDIHESALSIMAHCGLPDCTEFETKEMSKLGESTNFWKWYTIAEAVTQKVTKFPPDVLSHSAMAMSNPSLLDGAGKPTVGGGESVSSVRTLTASEFADCDAFAELLSGAGVDVSKYGEGKAKTVAALFKEVEKGESVLEYDEATKKVKRIVEPVFVQCRWRGHVLVEAEQVLEDGRVRKRNMLMAEKKSPEDESVCHTAFRGLHEELNLPMEAIVANETVLFRPDTYCCMAENLTSASYPDLPCVYVTHYCCVELLPAGRPWFKDLALEDHGGGEFETPEGKKINRWKWTEISEARKNKTKGFPEASDPQEAADGSTSAFEVIPAPTDESGLRAVLEVGGVQVGAWGDYVSSALAALLREIQCGDAELEQDVKTGKVRRVLRSALVQMNKVGGPPESIMEEDTEQEDDTGNTSKPESNLQWRSDLGCFELPHVDATSYPGLPCVHQTRVVQFARKRRNQRTVTSIQGLYIPDSEDGDDTVVKRSTNRTITSMTNIFAPDEDRPRQSTRSSRSSPK